MQVRHIKMTHMQIRDAGKTDKDDTYADKRGVGKTDTDVTEGDKTDEKGRYRKYRWKQDSFR